ncbi:MAG: thrombospondin type 3 repeat-containing protein [Bacteroidia bacterium]|nr:thrombospondin type 3 repeat-containing protein [Bacteroidia bacterium]
MSFAFVADAQFGITAGVSGLKFNGDVGKERNTNYFGDARMGYNFGVDYRVGKILGFGLNGMYGTLQGTDNSANSHMNFKSKIMGGEFNIMAFFDRLKDTHKVAAPFISVGVGYMMFDPYGDLVGANNKTYNYWKDGSIRDLPESTVNEPLANVIKRDYDYETQLKDSVANYSRSALYIPINLGMKFQMGLRTSVRFAVNYNIALTDYIDNYKNGGNDSWIAGNISLNYNFTKKPKDEYANIDFSAIDNADYDNDGVVDTKDDCLGTPKGAKVNGKGCPTDTDGDGIEDYMDAEPTTKPGAKVDGFGVTINEEDYAKRQMEWDSLAIERSEGFNVAPSLNYLKEVETKAKDVKEKSGKSTKVPTELQPADINKDGYISAEEITKSIDSFFDGESAFNVERLNRLIDFFFEQ